MRKKSSSIVELETVKFLRENGLSKLLSKFKLKENRHKKHPNLCILRYNQQKTDFRHKISRECRGLVLDTEDDFRVVCYAYEKFFNVHEKNQEVEEFDWNDCRVYDKLDGSICTLYFYSGEWHVASSSVADASGQLKNTTMKDLFWKVWKEEGYELPKDEDCCYMFELMSKDNPIVVVPQKDELVLHGVRRLTDYQEFDPSIFAEKNKWKCVEMHEFSSKEEVIIKANKLNPALCEGFVVVDKNFRRVKVKCSGYVSIAHLSIRDNKGLNQLFMLRIITKNEASEFLSYFPQWKELYEIVTKKYNSLIEAFGKVFPTFKVLSEEKFVEKCNQSIQKKDSLHALIPLIRRARDKGKDFELKDHLNEMESESLLELIKRTSKVRQKFSKEDNEEEEEDIIGIAKKKKKSKKENNEKRQLEIFDEEKLKRTKLVPEKKPNWKKVGSKKAATRKKPKKKSEGDLDELFNNFKQLDAQKEQQKKNK